MSNDVMIPEGLGGPAAIFKERQIKTERLGEGLEGIGFPMVGIKGKEFYVNHRGVKRTLMRKSEEDGGWEAVKQFDFVILRKAERKSHTFYIKGYQPGSEDPPDCVSTDGIAPDDASKVKQSTLCQGCPRYEWQDPLPNGRKGRECQDSLRLAILPVSKAVETTLGGVAITEPTFFRIPAASLKALSTFGDMLEQRYGEAPFCSFVMRVRFKPGIDHAQFEYSVVRFLNAEDAAYILELREHPQAYRILGLTPEGRSLMRRGDASGVSALPPRDPPPMDQGAVASRLAAERAERIAEIRRSEPVTPKPRPQTIELQAEDVTPSLRAQALKAAEVPPPPKEVPLSELPATEEMVHNVIESADDIDDLVRKMRPQ